MAAPEALLFTRVEGGKVVREHGGEVVVPWWSFTKTLIAAAVMRLAEAGEVELDAVVEGQGFTIRQVLRHEAGLPDYGGLPAYHRAVAAGDPPWPAADLLERVGPATFPPGRGWAYSNVGYLWLRELIERRRGPDALAELVLRPLGMDAARLALRPADLAGVRMGAAAGYDPGWVYHGLVVGPVREAALGLDRLAGGGLLSAESLSAMRRPTPLPQANRPPWRLAAYGAGMMTPETPDGVAAYGHTGGGPGSGIAVYRRDDPGRTVAAFALDEAAIAVEGPAVAMLEA
jgi:CubicO group peptidase (beta-lactamase class C family)